MRGAGRDSFEAIQDQDRVGARGRHSPSEKGNFGPIQLMFWEEVGLAGTQAIFESFCQHGGYKHLEIVILSNLKTYDEGLKSLCKYMETAKTIKQLELEINQISPIGCTYLGNALSPRNLVPTTKLNLSYNKFGSEGLKNLAKGLAENGTLEQLVLNGCEIDY